MAFYVSVTKSVPDDLVMSGVKVGCFVVIGCCCCSCGLQVDRKGGSSLSWGTFGGPGKACRGTSLDMCRFNHTAAAAAI